MKKPMALTLTLLLAISGCVQENTQTEITSTTTTISATTFAQTSLASSSTSSVTTTTTSLQEALLEVHEWGVLSGGSLDTSYNLLSSPNTLSDHPVVKEPVIYIHSGKGGTFDAEVVFKNGHPTESYPGAESKEDSFIWKNVKIVEESDQIAYPSNVLRTINDVDADALEYNDQKARSLFYEGTIEYENRILAKYNSDRKQAIIENRGSFPVYDLLLIVPSNYNKLLGKNIYADVVPKIGAGETVTITLKQVPAVVDYTQDLSELGYTQKEAQAFANLWEDAFQKVDTGKGALVYRLSQEGYDSLIELKMTPKPVKTIRSLYVMVCLTGKDTPAAPVIGSGFGIYQGQNLILSDDDIESYNRTSHEIKLTDSGLRAMRSRILYEEENGALVPKLGGLYLKAFSIRIDGVEMYSGTFWSRVSSSTNDGIVLLDVLAINSADSLKLEAGYPSASNYKGADPRNNTKIMQYLKEKNKLTE